MIREPACKINDFRVKNFNHSVAMACNLCLELAHFSLRSLQISFIQHFPKNMGKHEVEIYLSHLAVNKHVVASIQNQAFSGLLFLYKQAMPM